MNRILALLIAGLATAGLHLLFEVLITWMVGPMSKIYPFLRDLTTKTVWTYFNVFIVQGLLISIAFYFLEPAFTQSALLIKGLMFGFILWILAGVLPILPLCFLYKIGFTFSYALKGIVIGLFLAELMGITFVYSYNLVLK